ncbi:MAG: ABC transporter ATP-binding protein [Aggregatilineales bacterium]
MGEPLLEVRHLSKYFRIGTLVRPKIVRALEGVSFSIRRGQVIALVGESGSGKSTTARLISRLMPPSKGEILYKGRDILKTEPRRASLHYRSSVQMIFQDPFGSLNPVHPVSYVLKRPLFIHRKAHQPGELMERVYTLLETVGLSPATEFARKFPHELSGGQRQRVAIARALAVDPEVILADEPISMLDVSIRMGVLNLMESLKVQRGIGYLYITHDIASARYIADGILVMYAGYMVEGGDSELIIREPAHPYTRLLLSAVPNPSPGLVRQKAETRPEAPFALQGCPFASRCPEVMDICRQHMPGTEPLTANHWVRCHLYGAGSNP